MDRNLQDSELYEARFGTRESRSSFRFYIVFIFLLVLLIFLRGWWTNTFGGVQVDGTSMNRTLQDEDKLLMRYVEDAKELARGDVIVVHVGKYEECKDINGGYLIKRLIAIEGDKVKCRDGQIEICYAGTDTYVPLEEPYAYYMNASEYDFDEYEVGEGEIFFLGDNRNNSRDSRYYQHPTGSNLKDRLYKAEDVFGVVPDWAIEHKDILEKIFF